MATSDPPVRGMAAEGTPEAFTMFVNDEEIRVPTGGKNLLITVESGGPKGTTFKLPLNKRNWSLKIERI